MAFISVYGWPHARCSDPAAVPWMRASSDASTSKFPNGKSRDGVRVAHPERGVVWPSDLGTTRRPHRGLLTSRLPFRLQQGSNEMAAARAIQSQPASRAETSPSAESKTRTHDGGLST